MTLEEACRLLDPSTTAEELAKIEYYHGFNGKAACIQAIDDACTLLVDFVRSNHWEADSAEVGGFKVNLVQHMELKNVLNDLTRNGTVTAPRECFLCLTHTMDNRPVLVAMDNTTGDAWTEDFKDIPAALAWLGREGEK